MASVKQKETLKITLEYDEEENPRLIHQEKNVKIQFKGLFLLFLLF